MQDRPLERPACRSSRVVAFPSKYLRNTVETHILAALLTYDPTTEYFPVMGDDGKVYFSVNGSFRETLTRLYSEEPASILSFMDNLKNLRDIIFTLKKEKIHNRGVACN